MNMLELLETNPKTAIVVKQWLLDRLLTSMRTDSVPDDFKELVRQQGIDNNRVSEILNGSPRSLFDVFDDHKIYISLSVDAQGPSPVFRYSFDGVVESIEYTNRKDAETAAIIDAFKQLESKL
jgi:hypothetical protein